MRGRVGLGSDSGLATQADGERPHEGVRGTLRRLSPTARRLILCRAALTMPGGPLRDRFGRKPILMDCGASQVPAATLARSRTAAPRLGTAAVLGAYGRGGRVE